MRLTLTDLNQLCIDGSGGDNATASQTYYKQRINSRYGEVLAKLPSFLSEITRTFSTVADQQFYHYPPAIKEIESLSITINSVTYTLTPITSNQRWTRLNAIQITAGAIPLHYFKRQRDFGIWPIPQAVYTATIEYTFRPGGLVRTDYTTGTVTVTENDETVEGAGGTAWSTTTNLVADDWFSLTDSNGEPRGNWYRVGSVTDADTLELESTFEESTESGVTYVIGQSPDLPEDGHELLAYGALADYFVSKRQSPTKAKIWSNMYWTGDPGISRQTALASEKPWTGGGLLGLINDYRDRDSSQLINRTRDRGDPRLKVFAANVTA